MYDRVSCVNHVAQTETLPLHERSRTCAALGRRSDLVVGRYAKVRHSAHTEQPASLRHLCCQDRGVRHWQHPCSGRNEILPARMRKVGRRVRRPLCVSFIPPIIEPFMQQCPG